eukprot:333996-Pelagomonas_calceolata.AAC.3
MRELEESLQQKSDEFKRLEQENLSLRHRHNMSKRKEVKALVVAVLLIPALHPGDWRQMKPLIEAPRTIVTHMLTACTHKEACTFKHAVTGPHPCTLDRVIAIRDHQLSIVNHPTHEP